MSRITGSRLALACALVLGGGVTTAGLRTSWAEPPCVHRVLVVSAMPLELSPLVRQAGVTDATTSDGSTFYSGNLVGVDVLLAMTGIGPANATHTTQAAFNLTGCSFKAVVFSGVAGSQGNIGDVAIPARWSGDAGQSWSTVNDPMLAVAQGLAGTSVPLSQDLPLGDAACLCPGVDANTPVHLPQTPVVRVAGDGTTSDPFGGRMVPCLPGGGDIAGCEPCLMATSLPSNAATFAARAPALIDPGFVTALFGTQTATTSTADAQDEETASVLQVAQSHATPFLGIRGVSDGQGDPLGLPGFPFQFVVYRQLAANNAATVTTAFLKSWLAAGLPT